jgi:signal transduction histidine kinase/ligand-binding sensor domain-containing protein/DNA-binding response OmpR family regulator
MLIRTLVLIGLCLVGNLLTANAQQEDINFTSITTKEGLSANTVGTIIKDRYGLLWFGTEDGLDRFDGINLTVYRHKPEDAHSLAANEVLALHEDEAGNLWIGTSGGGLSRYDRQRNLFINYPTSGPNALDNKVVRGITSDKQGNIWIVHFAGVNILDPKTGKMQRLALPADQKNNTSPIEGMTIFRDSRYRIWVGTNRGLFYFNAPTRSFTGYFPLTQDTAGGVGNQVNVITEDGAGNIWVGSNNGLSRQQPGSDVFTDYPRTPVNGSVPNGTAISTIAVDGNRLWLGTAAGLEIINVQTGESREFRLDYRNIHSLTASGIRHIYIDNRGIYWVGTLGGGVNKYDRNLNLFNLVRSNIYDPQGLNAPVVMAFAEAPNNNVYVGTQGGGLSLFNVSTKLFQQLPIKSGRPNAGRYLTILTLEKSSRGQLLLGTYGEGLIVFDPATKNYRQIWQGSKPEDLNANDIYCIHEDRAGNIWVGTNGSGINLLNSNYQVVKRFTPLPKAATDSFLPINGYIRDIKEDPDGNIWIATHGGGIAIYYPASGKFNIYNTENSKLPNDIVEALLIDQRGMVWAATFGSGLVAIDRKTGRFRTFSEKDGIANSTVYEVQMDEAGRIWISTNRGISSIDPKTGAINNYNHHNGLQNNNFVRGAGLRTTNGTLFFGGLEGFNYFNPRYLKKNTNIPSVLLTDLKVSNQSVQQSENGPLKQNITIAKEIHLDFKQNFSISYVGLNYTAPEQNQYAFKLEGFDKDWNYVGSATTASYTNLDPGKYTFRVKASNNDGIWNEEGHSIKIYVHPPFWRSNYAYAFYFIAALSLLLYSRHRGIQRINRKFALKQERFKAEQERKEVLRIHELDQLKIKFLTNLSHEFRTPISLILGPADHLLAQEKDPQAKSHLYRIKRNAKRLVNLVNQLLDFRKMEEKELTLQLSEGELVSFVREAADSFNDLSERKKIAFTFNSEIQSLHTRFDHDKIERILFNVLSNAFKFTLEGGHIALTVKPATNPDNGPEKWVCIQIRDTGVGISPDKKDRIFERFFQDNSATAILNQGTGIGLAITKEFVQLHGGTISVESEQEVGTTFTIHLPFIELHQPQTADALIAEAATEMEEPVPTDEPETIAAAAPVLAGSTTKPSVLLVEDNEDFRAYLKDHLQASYHVLEAANGKEGWQKALGLHPQLVVSDISMPIMDGIELSRKLKSDKRTSHIPVILLTALTGEEDQLKGLQTGASDYITKPFNYEVLHTKINNLLVLNNTLKTTYTKQIKVQAPEMHIESDDEKLMKAITVYLEENLTNPQLSVEELSRNVGMSRSSLYSKLLELTGKTPVEFIRSVKLEKAAVLLEKSDMTIAQIGYSVGFSTPNYFAKSFKAKFNMLPSEYIALKRKNGQ